MVNATVDNPPVSIALNGSKVTVPSNETWVVEIVVHGGRQGAQLFILGADATKSSGNSSDPQPPPMDMVLTGGDVVRETNGSQGATITVSGFVVDS